VPVGAPAQATSGETPAPSQLNFDGIDPPSGNDGLESAKGTGVAGGVVTGDSDDIASGLADGFDVARAVAAGAEGGFVAVAGLGPVEEHPASRIAAAASQTHAIRRMPRLSTLVDNPASEVGSTEPGKMRDTTRNDQRVPARCGAPSEDLRPWPR